MSPRRSPHPDLEVSGEVARGPASAAAFAFVRAPSSSASASPSASAATLPPSSASDSPVAPAPAAPGDAPADTPTDLASAIASAVGPRDTSVPDVRGPVAPQLRPSHGAVMVALRAVLPSASACLPSSAAAREATVTFRSDGSVARVDAGAGDGAGACIGFALAKARVDPFADDTFTARVTVRPR